MEYRLDVGMWNQVFAVPCALVDQHLKLAGKEQLQVILWLLRYPGQGVNPEYMAKELGMSTDSALDALEYWCDQSLLCSYNELLSPMPQPQQTATQALKEPIQEAAPVKPHTPEQEAPLATESPQNVLPPPRRMPKPDSQHLALRLSESEGMRFLMQEAESILGKTLSPAMSAVLLAATDDYGLPPEVTVMLLHYAKEAGRTATSYIDSVARDWASGGIFSIEAAEEKLQKLSRQRLAWNRVSAIAGIIRRAPSKSEAEKAVRWIEEWGFSEDMLSAAYDICAENTGKFSASYMDKLLDSWHQAGIKTPAQAAGFIEKRKLAKQKKPAAQIEKSYDSGELESISTLDIPDDL